MCNRFHDFEIVPVGELFKREHPFNDIVALPIAPSYLRACCNCSYAIRSDKLRL